MDVQESEYEEVYKQAKRLESNKKLLKVHGRSGRSWARSATFSSSFNSHVENGD